MESRLTRERVETRFPEKETKNEVHLVIKCDNRGEAEFYFESLFAFLNRVEKTKKLWEERKANDQSWEILNAPEKDTIQKLRCTIDQDMVSEPRKRDAIKLVEKLEKEMQECRYHE